MPAVPAAGEGCFPQPLPAVPSLRGSRGCWGLCEGAHPILGAPCTLITTQRPPTTLRGKLRREFGVGNTDILFSCRCVSAGCLATSRKADGYFGPASVGVRDLSREAFHTGVKYWSLTSPGLRTAECGPGPSWPESGSLTVGGSSVWAESTLVPFGGCCLLSLSRCGKCRAQGKS